MLLYILNLGSSGGGGAITKPTGDTGASVGYAPGPVYAQNLQQYVSNELLKIASALSLLSAGHVDMSYSAPLKVLEGDIRLADGTGWNPGSGKGFYVYRGAAWHYLG